MMRWWVHVPERMMSIDNSSMTEMDLTGVPSDVYMAEWREGKGELEKLPSNGLREVFIDVMPYAPLFQRFMTKMKARALSLNQAKKIQIELIRQIFESKRQAPYHYPVAAGDYWWDAADETMGASTALGTQNVTAAVNQLIAATNKLAADINSHIIDVHNTNTVVVGNGITNGVNAGLVNSLNPIFASMRSELYNITVAQANEIYNSLTYPGNLLSGYLDNTVVGAQDGGNTVNGKLVTSTAMIGETERFFASPGFPNSVPIAKGNITFAGISPYAISTYSVSYIAPGTFNQMAYVPNTGMGSVSTGNVQWIPVGGTTPVTVTPAEQAAIMQGIATRTNDLNLKMNVKIQQVQVLTTVDAVIAYDVTTGW